MDLAIGVTSLRARLSHYLHAVSAGATVTISRHRRPIARLVPIVRSPGLDVLDLLAKRGVLQHGTGKPGKARRVRLRKGSRLVSGLVIEDRG